MLFLRIKLYYFNTETQQYSDRGIGNLHLKPSSDGKKTQLVVRADTSLGKCILNLIYILILFHIYLLLQATYY